MRWVKPLGDLTVTILAKPRHDEVITQKMARKHRAYACLPFLTATITASILTCMPDGGRRAVRDWRRTRRRGIAAVIRALDGDMQGRLLARHDVKGDGENRRIGEQELARCKAMGIEAGKAVCTGDSGQR